MIFYIPGMGYCRTSIDNLSQSFSSLFLSTFFCSMLLSFAYKSITPSRSCFTLIYPIYHTARISIIGEAYNFCNFYIRNRFHRFQLDCVFFVCTIKETRRLIYKDINYNKIKNFFSN